MNSLGSVSNMLLRNCLTDLRNCTTRQLQPLQQLDRIKGAGHVMNDSAHILNELLYHKNISSVVIIEVFALIGFILCFSGYRLLKTVLFLAGFAIGFLVFYAFSPVFINTKFCCAAKGKKEAHVGLSAVFGLVLAILSLKLYRMGVFAVGQCLGLVIALLVLCTPFHVYFDNNIMYGLFMATISCIVGSFTCKYERTVVILATSSGGSLMFLYGLDHVAKTTFSVLVESLVFRIKDVVFDGFHSEYTNWTYHAKSLDHYKALHFEKKAIPMFAVWCILSVVGCACQYTWASPVDTTEESKFQLPCLNCLDRSAKSDYA